MKEEINFGSYFHLKKRERQINDQFDHIEVVCVQNLCSSQLDKYLFNIYIYTQNHIFIQIS